MPLFIRARNLLRNLFSSRSAEKDLDQEMHAHLEMLMEETFAWVCRRRRPSEWRAWN
jgi:hypothetical protein